MHTPISELVYVVSQPLAMPRHVSCRAHSGCSHTVDAEPAGMENAPEPPLHHRHGASSRRSRASLEAVPGMQAAPRVWNWWLLIPGEYAQAATASWGRANICIPEAVPGPEGIPWLPSQWRVHLGSLPLCQHGPHQYPLRSLSNWATLPCAPSTTS